MGSDGFTVGSNATVNTNATVYHYVAWNEVAGLMDVGTYSGDGADNRNITGVGFAPELLIVKSDATTAKTAASTPMRMVRWTTSRCTSRPPRAHGMRT